MEKITNRTYSGSFSFEITEDNFRESAQLLAAFGFPVMKINGDPYIVSKSPDSPADESD